MKLIDDDDRITEASLRVTAWLQHVWELMDQERVDSLQPRPVYSRRKLLPPSKVDEVVRFLEDTVFQYEINNFPGYHYEEQGLDPSKHELISPQFHTLAPQQKRALVEEYDRIMQEYRDPSDVPVPA